MAGSMKSAFGTPYLVFQRTLYGISDPSSWKDRADARRDLVLPRRALALRTFGWFGGAAGLVSRVRLRGRSCRGLSLRGVGHNGCLDSSLRDSL